jgi:secondary thiamine-phosphate synthase enzyme
VARDLEMALERIVEDGWPWEHLEEGEVNPWSHVRAALTATSVVIPVSDGKLALGTWQGIFLCELDGPRTRKVYVSPLH